GEIKATKREFPHVHFSVSGFYSLQPSGGKIPLLDDSRNFLKQREKQAKQTKEEEKQDLSAEKLMRGVSKDVCWLPEQSWKVPRQVQSFKEKMAYFTLAKINIPSLPADDMYLMA
ncbi:WWC2, partial [Sigmodon hispidus]